MRVISSILAIHLVACGGNGGTDEDTSTDTAGDMADTSGDTSADSIPDTATDDAVFEGECTADGDCNDEDPCTSDICDLDYNECTHAPVDSDGDGYPAGEVGGTECIGGTDCDDADEDVHPDAAPDCTGVMDMDCDGLEDPDEDGDGYETVACSGDDCDDADADAFPGSLALECSHDRDCNGHPDADNDNDGHDSLTCEGDDCDDTRSFVYPGAGEVNCDGLDTDCTGDMSTTEDADQDGYANSGCVAAGAELDCDDDDAASFPGGSEICDEVDNDCDGTWADGGADDDVDGYLDTACGGNDCDDTDATNHPGADNDADGYEDARCGGDDCDDFDPAFNPGATLACTTEDRDCNGNSDQDNDGDWHVSYLCVGGDDCRDADASTILGECDGVNECCDGCLQRNGCWLDPTTGWLWEDPPGSGGASWDFAIAYCSGLSLAGHGAGEWHLPAISELRTFIRGCPETEESGLCGVTDACLGSACYHDCTGCTTFSGPGSGGCFWDPAVEGTCGWFWSSSSRASVPTYAWHVLFSDASVDASSKPNTYYARCVHTP